MAIEVDDGLLDYMAGSTGALHLVLRDTDDPDLALEAMRQAKAALFTIPHPEEPDDPLPSFASAVTAGAAGVTFWFDIADAEAYEGLLEQVLATVVRALEKSGVSGRLTGGG
jgi:hypothetical protein